MANLAPIGVFDSGLGGLSVWKEIVKILPNESIWYYADSANCPYGNKTQEAIIQLCTHIVDFLLDKQCKLIVVACNTATAAAIQYLRTHYLNTPFVGMEPAIKPAALQTKTKHVGVLATKGTLNGQLFNETSKKYAAHIKVHVQIGEGLVELVENQAIYTPQAHDLLTQYIQPMLDKNVDKIVLGCTHYPFLMPIIQKITPSSVEIIDPAPAVALQVKRLLTKYELRSDGQPSYHFFTTGDEVVLQSFLESHQLSSM